MNSFKTIRLSLSVSIIAGILCGSLPWTEAAVLADYNFDALTGTSTDSNTGSSAGTFASVNFPSSSGYAVSPVGNGAVFGTANDMGTTPGTAYFSFTISPTTVGTDRLNLAGTGALTFDTIRGTSLSAFGWVLRSSVDGFTTDVASGTTPTASVLNAHSVTLSSAFNFQDAAVEFRFYTSDGGENGKRC